MKLDKKKFIKNAPSGIKRQLAEHLDDLDGVEVEFKEGVRDGMLPQYFSNGQKYYLYPIYKSWCSEQKLLM